MSFFTIVPVLIDMLFDIEYTLDAMFLQACIIGNITLLEQVYTIHTIMSSDISAELLHSGITLSINNYQYKIIERFLQDGRIVPHKIQTQLTNNMYNVFYKDWCFTCNHNNTIVYINDVYDF